MSYILLKTLDEIKEAIVSHGPVTITLYDETDQLAKAYCLVGYNETGFLLSDGVCGLTYETVLKALELERLEASVRVTKT